MPSDVVCCVVCRAQHNTTQHNDADEAVVNEIDDSGEFKNPVADESPRGFQQLALNQFKNPVADESQESHSPSPSFCLYNTMVPWHCVVGWPQVHTDSTACRRLEMLR